MDLEKLQCQKVVWRSPAWQRKHAPGLRKGERPQIQLMLEGVAQSFFMLGSGEAFWDIDVGGLTKIAERIPDFTGDLHTDDEVEILLAMIMAIRKIDAFDAMVIIRKRYRALDLDSWYSKELLGLDEALEVMDSSDHTIFRDGQKQLENKSTSWAQFRRSFHKHMQAVKAGKPSGSGGVGTAASRARGKDRVAVEAEIPQAQLKEYMPPGVTCWQSRKRQAWCCHVKPRPRFSEPWGSNCKRAGNRIAMKAWAQYLELEGLDWSACPWQFDSPDRLLYEARC